LSSDPPITRVRLTILKRKKPDLSGATCKLGDESPSGPDFQTHSLVDRVKSLNLEVSMLKPYIAKVMQKQNLSATEAEQAMQIIMTGEATPAQIGGYLVALRMKGETVDEITGSARAMRAQATRLPLNKNGDPLLDTAGTGGDGAHTFNISTAAAFILAGAGAKVAKHGNRAASHAAVVRTS
jgi:hypothetical protein